MAGQGAVACSGDLAVALDIVGLPDRTVLPLAGQQRLLMSTAGMYGVLWPCGGLCVVIKQLHSTWQGKQARNRVCKGVDHV